MNYDAERLLRERVAERRRNTVVGLLVGVAVFLGMTLVWLVWLAPI